MALLEFIACKIMATSTAKTAFDSRLKIDQINAGATADFEQPESSADKSGPDLVTSLKLMAALQSEPLDTLQQLLVNYGPLVKLQLGLSEAWIVSNPADIDVLLFDNASHYTRSGLFRSFKAALGNGLLVSDGASQAGLHELMGQALQPKRLKSLANIVEQCVEQRSRQWLARPGSIHNLNSEMNQLALELCCRLLFGREGDALARELQPHIATGQQWMNDRSRRILSPPRWLPSSENRQLRQAISEIDKILKPQLRHARPRMRDAHTIMDLLLGLSVAGTAGDNEQQPSDPTQSAADGEGFNEKVILDELRGFLLLAQRNLSQALVWSSWLTAKHPAVQQQLQQEAKQLDSEQQLEASKAAYARMVIEESLRLYPPTWAFARFAVQDTELADRKIRRGSLILIPSYLVHRSSAYWEKPAEFDPQRFSAVNRINRHRSAWLPFGAGPFQCVGMQLSISALQLITSQVAKRGSWQLDDSGQPPGLSAGLTLNTGQTIRAQFTPAIA